MGHRYASKDSPTTAIEIARTCDEPATPGRATSSAEVVQRRVNENGEGRDPTAVRAAAERGAASPASALPYADKIQRLFGHHDISSIAAHTGPQAAASAGAIGAHAYAMGNHVVLRDPADLHTVAHEVAHVVQQRGGVQCSGGVGQSGDAYERHADLVADRVVQGQSAVDLLDNGPGSAGSTRAARDAGSPGHTAAPIQFTRTFSSDITDPAKQLLERVLRSNPVLWAMWQWIKNHDEIHLDIVKSTGFASVDAKLGEKAIKLKLHPDRATDDPAGMLETLSHEVTLHMLPWARPMMTLELKAHGEDMDASQLERIKTVLGPIAPSVGVFAREISADFQNKETPTFGGNHSDLALWTIHLQNVLAMASTETSDANAALLVAKAVEKMVLPMKLTGKPEDTVDRGEDVFAQFSATVNRVHAYRDKITNEQARKLFLTNILAILTQAQEYKKYWTQKQSASKS